MPTLPDVHLRGTRAQQPAANTVTVGALYCVTDQNLTERSNGTAWESWSGTGSAAGVDALNFLIDGAGSVITVGVKGFLEVPFACTITAVTLLSADAASLTGSIVVDIWKDTLANFPPTVADTITASAKPTISAAKTSKNTTLTGWNKTLAAGDILAFKVDSAATLTRVALSLTVQAT